MEKTKFQRFSHRNYWENPPADMQEVITDVSLTVPDESLTVRQILDNYSRGLPTVQKIPQYATEEYNQAALDTDDQFDDIIDDLSYRDDLKNRIDSILADQVSSEDPQDPEEPKTELTAPVTPPDLEMSE